MNLPRSVVSLMHTLALLQYMGSIGAKPKSIAALMGHNKPQSVYRAIRLAKERNLVSTSQGVLYLSKAGAEVLKRHVTAAHMREKGIV